MKRLLVGYFMGVAIGLPVGLLMASNQSVEDTVGSVALGFQTLPSVCWVPLALIWFGQSRERDAVRRGDGHHLVGDDRDQPRRPQHPADPGPRRPDHGVAGLPPLDAGGPAGLAAVPGDAA